jgi:hypothetical protein
MPAESQSSDQVIEAWRLRRAEMRESMSALEQALAAPAVGRRAAWGDRVHVALVELASDFREHVAVTEGPRGVYSGVVKSTPRLSDEITRLGRDHAEIKELVDRLLIQLNTTPIGDDIDDVRDLGTALLVRLIRSRQRSADLVYEAYQADIGGEA